MNIDFIAINVSDDNNLMYYFYNTEIAFSVDTTNVDIILECNSKAFDKRYYTIGEIKSLPTISKNRRLVYSFTTHHHLDHSSGDKYLKSRVPGIIQIRDTCDTFNIENIIVRCIRTPCHTQDSICILVDNKYLCTGDTIFYLGCGRFFEGTASDMYRNICKLKELPDDILMLYGHDYRISDIRYVESMYSVPCEYKNRPFLTIREEKEYNPFFRAKNSHKVNTHRTNKNNF